MDSLQVDVMISLTKKRMDQLNFDYLSKLLFLNNSPLNQFPYDFPTYQESANIIVLQIIQMNLDDEQQELSIRIKNFLAQDSQFRNPGFDPAPFLIKILKQKESDHQAIIGRQQQLIQLQNEAFELVDQIAGQHTGQIFKLLQVPKKMGQQLQKLKSNMSLVKKKVKETKSLLMNTQKDIDQIYFNCMYNKLIYQKLKEIQIKLNQYETASLALKNNQFYECSINMPSQIGNSILQASLTSKTENLKLKLLSRAIQQVSLFLYLTPKIVVPSTQSLLERAPGQQNLTATVSQHQAFHKRYLLFQKANCLQYLPTIWTFKDFQRKSGKIGVIFDIVKGIMNIGKINQIAQSLELDCKKSIDSIFLLLQYYFAKQLQSSISQPKNSQQFKKSSKRWFMCRKYDVHKSFISTILNISGAILRKLIIVRMIFKEYEVTEYNLNSKLMFQTILSELNQLITQVYFKHDDKQENPDYLRQQIMQKINNKDNYIFWVFIKKTLLKGLVTIQKNIMLIEQEVFKPNALTLNWEKTVNISQLDTIFYQKFHLDLSKTLVEVFSHEGRSFAMQSLEQILNFKQIGEYQTNFCKFFSPQQIKFTKQHVYMISLLQALKQYLVGNQFSVVKFKKYCLFVLCTFYYKMNYYLQRFLICPSMIEKINEVRKTNNKVKAKEKDLKRQYFKLCSTKKDQIKVKPWRKNNSEEMQLSKYRLVQKLKAISKQNQMFINFSMKFFYQVEKFKDSPNILANLITIQKLQPTNYDENLGSKLIRIWDQLPESQEGIMEMTTTLFQKIIELHLTVIGIIYVEGSQ